MLSGEKIYRVIWRAGYYSLEFTKGKHYFLTFFMNHIVIMGKSTPTCIPTHMHTHVHACPHTDICSILVVKLSKYYSGVGKCPIVCFLVKVLA